MNARDLLAVTERVRASIRTHMPPLADGAPCLLAASGGADSAAMVSLLCEVGAIDATRSVIAHFDHRLRSAEAAHRDRLAIDALASRYHLRVVAGAWSEPQRDEASARAARYRFLRDVASAHEIDLVATGHTADDQAETVLMHAMRGAGLHGLAGMAPRTPWPHGGQAADAPVLLRPLLSVTRAETRAWCAHHRVAYEDDPTNDDRAYLRNRVRLDLLPRLEHHSPHLRDTLLALAAAARTSADALDAIAADAITGTVDGGVALSRPALHALPGDAASHAFRLALLQLRGHARDIERRHYALLAAAAAAAGRTGATLRLPGGITATVDADLLILSEGPLTLPAIAAGMAQPLPWSGTAGAWRIDVRPAPPTVDAETIVVPAGAVLRGRRAGDRIRLSGGRKTLQDLYVDRKVPRRWRDATPIIANDAGHVYWTPWAVDASGQDGPRYRVTAIQAPHG